ncbi:YEATS domain-containing protein 2 [Brienomyrus brachyistius]|uniref:YEATS domain-containing protein 2 n=1 Tax=Brienomyrus brachyistius TaxID=42636 RepID=UPI0020B28B4C|nr:YEATS domain-containing protein 2 [Brienomyrus brachyistius]
MSGIKRKIEDNDPDYEDISVVPENKRLKAVEQNAREATVQKIEGIIKDQFSLEMKSKEHEIEVIGQRLNEARRMMDKLRACIVANYYANAGQPKVLESGKSDASVLNHPAIKRFLESPSRSSSPFNQGSETPSLVPSEAESLSQTSRQAEGPEQEEGPRLERRPGRNVGKDSFGVLPPVDAEPRFTFRASREDSSRLYVKKTIVVGNVSKYIPPDKREENDQSTHKWMVYVRGSRREPSIDHFVKKVWFFLHPSYKPNDLVEVSEPPFHLTRRGWGEFPVRVQIHFKDARNKRVDIIHHLKLDRTYTGLQTLGAETVVDVELHRNSVGEDLVSFPCSSSSSSSSSSFSQQAVATHPPSSTPQAPLGLASVRPASPGSISQDSHGLPIKSEVGRSGSYGLLSSDRTPSRPKVLEKITLGSHSNSAFQPITASCKIVPQGQAPNPAESPGKSFQPITMSCKIVSGSPISTPSHSPLPRTPTSTPVHMKQGSSVINNPYIIVDKPGQVAGMGSPSAAVSAGSPTGKQTSVAQASPGTHSPAPKVHAGSFLSSGMKVIIKQEPGEVSTAPQQPAQQVLLSAATPQHAAAQQFVAVKGGHVIAVSPQKQSAGPAAPSMTQNKVVGIPVGSALQSAVKQVAISSGQILVAKSSPAVSKVMGHKQVIAQGVAKAIVSGAGGSIVGQQVQTVTKATATSSGAAKAGGQGSVMATLQLPANNLASLANLPPGTKLYLTTNSKNPSGKGKLLLIPQGAILRASNPSGQQPQATPQSGAGTSQAPPSTSSSSSSLPSNLSYTSYILKQTPQGTFLVGQPVAPGSGKPGSGPSGGNSTSSTAPVPQQAIRVTAGQKAAILAQVVGGSQGSQVKLSDGSVKTVTAAAHLAKPSGSTLRMAGSVVAAPSSAAMPHGVATATPSQQPAEGSGPSSGSAGPSGGKALAPHPVLVAASQAAVGGTAKGTVVMARGGSPAAVVTVAKSVNVPVISLSKGAAASLVGSPKNASPSLVAATASLVPSAGGAVGGKAAALSGMLKIHSGQASTQQTVLTIPANQLKQLGVSSSSGGGLQTILMPVSKVVPSGSAVKTLASSTLVAATAPPPATAAASGSTTPGGGSATPPALPTAAAIPPATQVKTEPEVTGAPGGAAPPPGAEGSTPITAPGPVKQEPGAESGHDLIDTEHIENLPQLLTAAVKKFPLIVPQKTEDSPPFCADSLEQYYSWNIGKRRAAELQRAVAVKGLVQDVLEKSPGLQANALPKTKEVVQWCRQRGYTPPDPEPQRSQEDSIEDILTQIDSEPECPSTLLDAEELCQRLEELQALLKTEAEPEDEPLDIVGVAEPVCQLRVKQEELGEEQESHFYLGPSATSHFVRDAAQQIGVSFQPVEVEKNIYAPVVEEMILKAVEQFASDVLRESLAGAYLKAPQNRAPREITAIDVHQAVAGIAACDFLTNKYMGCLVKDEAHTD